MIVQLTLSLLALRHIDGLLQQMLLTHRDQHHGSQKPKEEQTSSFPQFVPLSLLLGALGFVMDPAGLGFGISRSIGRFMVGMGGGLVIGDILITRPGFDVQEVGASITGSRLVLNSIDILYVHLIVFILILVVSGS